MNYLTANQTPANLDVAARVTQCQTVQKPAVPVADCEPGADCPVGFGRLGLLDRGYERPGPL